MTVSKKAGVRVTLLLAFVALARAQSAIPRPEFPQPQFERKQWLSLNGAWEFEFDDNNAGLRENWASTGKSFSRRITVPYCFESKLSGIGDTSFHPYIWYRRSINVPTDWAGKHVLLHFGAVDYRAMVWVNGNLAGRHEGGHTPFEFDITAYLKPGANTVSVRAEDPPTDRFIPRGKQYWEPKSRGIFYTRTSGVWQPVWLEAVGDNHLDKVRTTATMDGVVTFEARTARPESGLHFSGVIQFQGRDVGRFSAAGDGSAIVSAVSATDARLWSPDNPNLYDVVFELRRGDTTIDRVHSYFGFRTVTLGSDRILLNRRPVFLRMVLDQGYWPDGILTPPSDAAIQYDIKMTKAFGFNGARKHQKVEDPRYLYWADKMGLLVSSEMANAPLFDERYVGRFTREWIEAVERDYNHPSIIMWIPINESWGTPNLADPRQQAHLASVYWLTKSLDSTRLAIDNDGWEHTGTTDLMGIHDYARTGADLEAKYKDLQRTAGSRVPDNGRPAMIPGFHYNGSPYFLSEFGGVAYLMPGGKNSPDAWGYAGVETDEKGAFERIRGLFEAAGRIPGNAGFCYTQLTDVEQEANGLLTYDRKPKFDPERLRPYVERRR
ncbi:MAG: sugar-binding domain-containing protein [Bryobacteraceae bacterium]